MSRQTRKVLIFLAGCGWATAIGIAAFVLTAEVDEVDPASHFLAGRLSSFAALAGTGLAICAWFDRSRMSAITAYDQGLRDGMKVGSIRARNGTVPSGGPHKLNEHETPPRGRS